jgi:hypothetical protein
VHDKITNLDEASKSLIGTVSEKRTFNDMTTFPKAKMLARIQPGLDKGGSQVDIDKSEHEEADLDHSKSKVALTTATNPWGSSPFCH